MFESFIKIYQLTDWLIESSATFEETISVWNMLQHARLFLKDTQGRENKLHQSDNILKLTGNILH